MLFGSLAWRDPTPQSDIDLIAIYDNVGYRQRRKRQRELATLAVRRVAATEDPSVGSASSTYSANTSWDLSAVANRRPRSDRIGQRTAPDL